MPRIQPFETHTNDYERWFDQHPLVYESELQAVRQLLPRQGNGLEIGVGSGRFAGPLNIRYGIEPSPKMCEMAKQYPICLMSGIAESLPIRAGLFDFALMVTTLCFVDDVNQSFREIHRILRPEGSLILGFVDRESPIGQRYQQNRAKSRFYREAEFYSVDEVRDLLKKTGFLKIVTVQTLFSPLEKITRIEPVKPGYGEGSFVVVKANK